MPFGFVNPFRTEPSGTQPGVALQRDLGPVNRQLPPWGQTASGLGEGILHPVLHPGVQHPNMLHFGRDAVVPFRDSMHAEEAYQGRARHWPKFSYPGGLTGGVRK